MKFLLLFLFSSCAFADGFYLEGGISAMQNQGTARTMTMYYGRPTGTVNGVIQYDYTSNTLTEIRPYDINNYCNPYGDIGLGYDRQWRRFTLDLGAFHNSALRCGDHGQNYVKFNLRWYPFAH